MMEQYARIRLKMPEGVTVADLEKELLERGFKVEITGCFCPIMGIAIPEDFKVKERDTDK